MKPITKKLIKYLDAQYPSNRFSSAFGRVEFVCDKVCSGIGMIYTAMQELEEGYMKKNNLTDDVDLSAGLLGIKNNIIEDDSKQKVVELINVLEKELVTLKESINLL